MRSYQLSCTTSARMSLCSLFYFFVATLVVGTYGTRNDPIYNVQALRARLGSEGTKKFEIPTRLPNVTFEIPPSWGGYQPVSPRQDETRQLYFWMSTLR